MNIKRLTKIIISSVLFIIITQPSYANDDLDGYSIYPFGGTFHRKPTAKTNDGNLDYMALSKSYKKWGLNIESGAGTFIDSYHTRSYVVFSNISSDKYKWGSLTPMVELHCLNKGSSHTEYKRKTICSPAFKIRIGAEKGIFANLTPVPPLGELTNGQLAFEVGYKF